jgi:uncharacterized protein (UPF0548 family)
MFLVRPPDDDRLDRLLADMAGQDLTYPEVGATEEPGALPGGYHHGRAETVVGEGDADFAAAVDGIRTWRLHRGQGIRVAPAEPPVAPGTDVALVVPSLGLHVFAACRIVWVVDEPERFGFGYGTLPVHPASGEEAFVVDRAPGGEVRLSIVAFSRPRHPLARLGAPVMRRQQARATAGYMDALRRHVALSRDRGPGPSAA